MAALHISFLHFEPGELSAGHMGSCSSTSLFFCSSTGGLEVAILDNPNDREATGFDAATFVKSQE